MSLVTGNIFVVFNDGFLVYIPIIVVFVCVVVVTVTILSFLF